MATEFLNLRSGTTLPDGSHIVVECLKALEKKCIELETSLSEYQKKYDQLSERYFWLEDQVCRKVLKTCVMQPDELPPFGGDVFNPLETCTEDTPERCNCRD